MHSSCTLNFLEKVWYNRGTKERSEEMKQKTETSCPYICIYESYMDVLSPFSDAERGRLLTAMLKQWGVEHRQVYRGSFPPILRKIP